jgi:ATP-dependent DNA ligase
VVDGVIVTLDTTRKPLPGALESRIHATGDSEVADLAGRFPATFIAVDLLYEDGRSLLPLRAEDRRDRLENLDIDGAPWATSPRFSEPSPRAALDALRPFEVDRLVVKSRGAAYRPGTRSSHWHLVHRAESQEFVIGGWTPGSRDRAPIDRLLLGVHRDGRFEFSGTVADGLDEQAALRIRDLLVRHDRCRSPFSDSGPDVQPDGAGVRWASPVIVGAVEFDSWPAEGLVHRSYGFTLREGHDPDDVVRRS